MSIAGTARRLSALERPAAPAEGAVHVAGRWARQQNRPLPMGAELAARSVVQTNDLAREEPCKETACRVATVLKGPLWHRSGP
jgi:hypothetical protein